MQKYNKYLIRNFKDYNLKGESIDGLELIFVSFVAFAIVLLATSPFFDFGILQTDKYYRRVGEYEKASDTIT